MATELVPYSLEDIANEFYLDEQDTEELLNCFRDLSMLDFVNNAWVILNWNKRQYKSDDSNERVTRFRQKQANIESETLQSRYSNALVTPPDAESDTDTESDTDRDAEARTGDPFDDMRILVETLTGLPIPNNQADILSISEFLTLGVIEEDIRDAIAFFSGNGRVAKGPAALLPSVRIACAKRKQKISGRKSEKPYIPEEHASEVYT